MHRLIAMTLLATLLTGCSGDSSPTLAPNVSAKQQASAARSMRLAFPPQTRFLLYHRASEAGGLPGPDDAVHLKIELPARALQAFLAQPPLSAATWADSRTAMYDNPNWPQWRPSKAQKVRYAEFELPHGCGLYVLIDDDRDDVKVVYLRWFET